jgi:hypothetical protein
VVVHRLNCLLLVCGREARNETVQTALSAFLFLSAAPKPENFFNNRATNCGALPTDTADGAETVMRWPVNDSTLYATLVLFLYFSVYLLTPQLHLPQLQTQFKSKFLSPQ